MGWAASPVVRFAGTGWHARLSRGPTRAIDEAKADDEGGLWRTGRWQRGDKKLGGKREEGLQAGQQAPALALVVVEVVVEVVVYVVVWVVVWVWAVVHLVALSNVDGVSPATVRDCRQVASRGGGLSMAETTDETTRASKWMRD